MGILVLKHNSRLLGIAFMWLVLKLWTFEIVICSLRVNFRPFDLYLKPLRMFYGPKNWSFYKTFSSGVYVGEGNFEY